MRRARATPSSTETGPVPAPVVSPEAYDEAYYLSACAGKEEWSRSEGASVAGRYRASLEIARFSPGEVLVDIGAGRGELIATAGELGAAEAVGIEYSEAAVGLARRTLEAHRNPPGARMVQADARALPLPAGYADLVTLLDVVEHLSPDELARNLREARRILKPRGRVFVHTFPNRNVYAITYRLQRALLPWRLWRWPAEPRVDYERSMHVNEQTVGSLRRALDGAGFDPVKVWLGRWVHTTFVPTPRAKRVYHRLAARPITARLGAADIWAEGGRPAETARTEGGRPAHTA